MTTTVHAAVATHAAERPDAVAILDPAGRACSYRQLERVIHEVASTLNRAGIGRGDTVAVVLPNGPEMAMAFIALASCTTCAPLNPAYREAEFEFYLSDLGARALVVQRDDPTSARTVARSLGIPVVELESSSSLELRLVIEKEGEAASPGLASPSEIALVLHTSGTTARPKIVPLAHANLCASGASITRTLALTPADRCLDVMPLFHIHGLIAGVLASLYAGASVVCPPGFDMLAFFGWIADTKPTWYTAVPTMHQAILSQAEAHRELIARHRLRFVRSSSAAMPRELITKLETALDAPFIEAYGMTEAAHQMASNPLPPAVRKPGTVGRGAGPEVAVMDEAGMLLSAGIVGEVVIRGPNVFGGYLNNPKANAESFTDGWFRTGDLGSLDADGYLTLTGRKKEIINRAGEKIAPREVDEVLMTHPGIAQAVTFAVPHPTLGEGVAVAVVLAPSAAVSARELREFARQRLAEFKVPQWVLIVDAIPKGPSGKLQRIGLAEKFADKLKEDTESGGQEPGSELERALAGVWQRVLRRDRVGTSENFFSLGGDSLLATLVVTQAQALGIHLSIDALARHPTIAELAVSLGEVTPKVAVVAAPATAGAGATRRPRATTIGGTSAAITWLVHPPPGAAGASSGPRETSARVFEAPKSIDAGMTVDGLAVAYVDVLLEAQPEGPYVLAGYGDLGGAVAFEMANRLRVAGQSVSLLALVDASAPTRRRWRLRPERGSLVERYTPSWLYPGRVAVFSAKGRDLARGWQRLSTSSIEEHAFVAATLTSEEIADAAAKIDRHGSITPTTRSS